MRILNIQNVSIAYDNKTVAENVSFEVFSGDYICIVGENGSGKSTLMKAILGLMPIRKGEINFEGGLKQTEIGYLPQQSLIQRDFPATVWEVVLSGCLNRTSFLPFYIKTHKQRAENMLKSLSIENLRRKSFAELSGGQQQRVLLARALCSTEKLLILDEPTAGLDPNITLELYDLFEKLNRESKITILMVSHDIDASVKHAGKILHMETRLKFFGNGEEYKNAGFWEGRV